MSRNASQWLLVCVLGALALLAGCGSGVQDIKPGDTDFVSAGFGTSSRSEDGAGSYQNNLPSAAPTDTNGESGTEQVVREIEEADLVKLVGNYLYILNTYRGLRVVDVSDWAKPELGGAVAVTGEPLEMYVVDDLAIVVTRRWSQCRLGLDGKASSAGGTSIYAVNIAQPEHPSVVNRFDLDGYVAETRRVGDVIYVAGYNQPPWYGYAVEDSGNPQSETQTGFVASVSIADPENVHVVQQEKFTGNAQYIHATTDAIFIAAYDWTADETSIQYVDIADPTGRIAVRGSCRVPGFVLNRFSLDAYNGVLRVVAQSRPNWNNVFEAREDGERAAEPTGPGVKLFTFDLTNPDEIAPLGELKIIANESLRAVRFAGDVGYVVTFEQVDPLWVIDLRTPAEPKITGELEVPGYSNFLIPDGDRLVAMAVDENWSAAVALYDVADPGNPKQLDKVSLGEYASSQANYDDKAFKVIPELKLILVPFDVWTDKGGYVNKLTMLDYAEDELAKLATVSHRGSVSRSGLDAEHNVLWVLSAQALQAFNVEDRTDPESLATLAIAENVIQYKSSGDYGLRLVCLGDYWNTSGLELQAVPADNPDTATPLSAKAIDVDGWSAKLVLLSPSRAAVVGTEKYEKTRIISIDLTKLPELVVLADQTFDFMFASGYYAYYGYDYAYRGGVAEPGFAAVDSAESATGKSVAPAGAKPAVGVIAPYLCSSVDPLVLDNGALALTAYGTSFDKPDYWKTYLKLIRLDDAGKPVVAASILLADYEADENQMVLPAAVAGNRVYVTSAKVMINDVFGVGYPQAKFYLRIIDAADPTDPSVGDPINIPGVAVGLTDNAVQGADAVFTVDPYWTRQGTMNWRFCSLILDAGQAVLQEAIDLPKEVSLTQVYCRNGLALLKTDDWGWYGGVVPLASRSGVADDAVSATTADTCNLGASTLIAIDVSDPTDIVVASKLEYPAQVNLSAYVGDYLVGQVSSTEQLVVWSVGENGSLTLDSLTDLAGWISDLDAREGWLDLALGMAGIQSVKLGQ